MRWPRLNRRRILKALGITGAVVVLPASQFYRSAGAPEALAQTSTGELYGGFLLLSEGASVPLTVRSPMVGTSPIFEQLPGGAAANATTIDLPSVADVAAAVSFPIYSLSRVPPTLRQQAGSLVRNVFGQVLSAAVSYNRLTAWQGRTVPEVSVGIIAQPHFPRPFPVPTMWGLFPRTPISLLQPTGAPPPLVGPPMTPAQPSGAPVTLQFTGTNLISPQKVSFTPAPGVLRQTARGFLLHWIQNDILYTAFTNDTTEFASPSELVALLAPVRR